MPSTRKTGSKAKCIEHVAQLLFRVTDANVSPRQADELIDEISQLLWAVSSLDPDAENLLKHSDYLTIMATHAQG